MSTLILTAKDIASMTFPVRHGKDPVLSDIQNLTFNDVIFPDGSLVKDVTFNQLANQVWTFANKTQIVSSSGANSPGTATNDASVGTIAWDTPNNAKVSDGVYTRLFSSNVTSQYLKVSNFGFSIPTDSTVVGVLVEVQKHQPSHSGAIDNSVKLVKGGSVTGTEHADTTTLWPAIETYVSYGSSSDLWGTTLTPSDVNSSGFGVVVSGTNDSGTLSHDIFIDHVRITVFYSNPPTLTFPTKS